MSTTTFDPPEELLEGTRRLSRHRIGGKSLRVRMPHEGQCRRERKGGLKVFGFKRKGPDKAFSHAEGCRILAADPTVSIEWNELESGHWRAVCVCGTGDYYEPVADRVRLDPLDPKTSRHAPQCEHRDTTDPVLIRAILKVRDGAGGDYWWVECSACDCAWQVPHYAESVG